MMGTRKFVFAASAAALFLLAGCFGQGGSGDPNTSTSSSSSASGPAAVYDTTSIDVSIGDGSGSSAPGALFVGTFADVVRVEVVVSGEDKYGDDQANLATVELTEDPPGTWSGTIPDLPVDPELNFVATGYDASDTPIFSGSTAQVLLGGGGDVVAIQMLPYDDNVAILFPIINSITRPAEIINNEDAAVDVAVTGSSDETLSYEYTSGGGTFTAPSGSITVASNGAGTINTTYTAPDPVGPYSHSIRLTNSQGNSVETDFGTLIVYELTDADVVVTWAPVITALSGHRTDGDVTWTATVTDDKPLSELTFSWSFAQSDGPTASFSTSDANPGVMSGYDETVAGEVTLSVTDADGLTTTVTFTLNAGQFPDVVVVEPSVGVVPADYSAELFPIAVQGTSYGLGGLTFAAGGNLIAASTGPGVRAVYSISPVDGSLTVIATIPQTYLLGITFDPASNTIYVGADGSGQIYSVDPVTGTSSLLTSLSGSVNGLTMAPADFGAFGGQIIAATSAGNVYAVDPASPGLPVLIVGGLGTLSDAAFAEDGTLFVSGSTEVKTVSPNGTFAVIASGFSSADGIAIDNDGGRIFLADSGTDTLYSIPLAGGPATPLGGFDFDDGHYVSGLAWDGVDTLIMETGESNLTLRAIDLP